MHERIVYLSWFIWWKNHCLVIHLTGFEIVILLGSKHSVETMTYSSIQSLLTFMFRSESVNKFYERLVLINFKQKRYEYIEIVYNKNIIHPCVVLLFIVWLYTIYFWHRKGNKTDPDREQKIISTYMCAGKIYLEYIHIRLSQIHALPTVPSIETCNYSKNSNNLVLFIRLQFLRLFQIYSFEIMFCVEYGKH